MKDITCRRRALALNRPQLARNALLHPATVGVMENGWATPCAVEPVLLDEAFKWGGDPQDSPEEVGKDESATYTSR
jgi:hypothetical protein